MSMQGVSALMSEYTPDYQGVVYYVGPALTLTANKQRRRGQAEYQMPSVWTRAALGFDYNDPAGQQLRVYTHLDAAKAVAQINPPHVQVIYELTGPETLEPQQLAVGNFEVKLDPVQGNRQFDFRRAILSHINPDWADLAGPEYARVPTVDLSNPTPITQPSMMDRLARFFPPNVEECLLTDDQIACRIKKHNDRKKQIAYVGAGVVIGIALYLYFGALVTFWVAAAAVVSYGAAKGISALMSDKKQKKSVRIMSADGSMQEGPDSRVLIRFSNAPANRLTADWPLGTQPPQQGPLPQQDPEAPTLRP